MTTLLLIIIYASFISLGLPDSLFGVTWPVAHVELGIGLDFASLLTILVGACTACTSIFAGRCIRRFGTGPVTAFSVLLTAAALFGISLCPSVWWMIPCMILLGTGAGAVDVGLNDYVSAHYKAQHMNWLHCFWGIGVTASPLVMSWYLGSASWRSGYQAIAFVQCGFSLMLFLALPLWKRVAARSTPEPMPETPVPSTGRPPLTAAAWLSIAMLALYGGFEFILSTWSASYLILFRGLDAARAATGASLFFGGIMLGRLVSGFVAMRFSDRALIGAGLVGMLLGAALLSLPAGWAALAGLFVTGFGCGPVFPCTLHATAARFGKAFSADYVGYQMGGSYFGSLVIQPLFGFIATRVGFAIMPGVLIGLAALQLVLLWVLEKRLTVNQAAQPPSV